MQKRWVPEVPLVKIIVPFLTGILFFHVWEYPLLPVFITFLFLLFIYFILHAWWRFSAPVVFALLSFLLILLGSGMLTEIRSLNNQPHHFSKISAIFFSGYVLVPPEEKDKSYKTVILIDEAIDSQHHQIHADGRLLVYFEKDSALKNLQAGDKILFPADYKPVDPPKNPGQFDYKTFLSDKYIYHQSYFKSRQIAVVHCRKKFLIKRLSNAIALWVQDILRKYIPGKEQFALADGILLGQRNEIDDDLYNAFAYTGILHILSVSGLHVGIVYVLLAFLLSFIPDRNRKIKIAKFIFIALFIWLFAFVTGSGAAVVRAALLFTLLQYGKLNNEQTNQVNLLCGAALIQLLIDPMLVYDIGFQLSYLAMLGIFLLYKRIYSLFYSPNRILDWTWQLWSASLAAQFFTLPLSIYYFGNFPVYFLFANIFAIPLSTLILWFSMALIPLSFIPAVAIWAGKLTSFVVSLFIKLTLLASELPFGKTSNLYIDPLQVLILFSALGCFSYYLLRSGTRFLYSSLILVLVVVAISFVYNFRQLKRDEIILYSIPGQFVAGGNQGGNQTLYTFNKIPPKPYNFGIKSSQRIFRVSSQQYNLLDTTHQHLYCIEGKTFYLLNKQNSRLQFGQPLKIDYLVLSGNLYLDIEKLKNNYRYRELLIAADNDTRHIRIYKKLLSEAKLGYADLSEQAKIIPL